MGGSSYIWIVVGGAFGLPVYASSEKYTLYHWLITRQSHKNLRVFRWGGPKGMIEVCKPCLLNAPNQPVEERGHP